MNNKLIKITLMLFAFFAIGFLSTYITDYMVKVGIFGCVNNPQYDSHIRYYWWLWFRVTSAVIYVILWIREMIELVSDWG